MISYLNTRFSNILQQSMHEESEDKPHKSLFMMARESKKGIPGYFARTITDVLRGSLHA
jgi:hypothetical protein